MVEKTVRTESSRGEIRHPGTTTHRRYRGEVFARTPLLQRFAWLSIATAVLTITLKAVAARVTGSVGLLSDAIESVVNLVAAIGALIALRTVHRGPDQEFAFGREKAEYLSAGVEGTMILVAAGTIIYAATKRLLSPVEVEGLGVGLIVSACASACNLATAITLIRAGKTHSSIALEADGRHLMTDVWTSVGVLIGVGAVAITDWPPLDPIIAIAVAVNILFTAVSIIRKSVKGLMDAQLPAESLELIEAVFERYRSDRLQFHAVRTRAAGRRSFMSFHVLVPGQTSVMDAHSEVDRLEAELHSAIPGLTISSHIEPLEDPRSHDDQGLAPLA